MSEEKETFEEWYKPIAIKLVEEMPFVEPEILGERLGEHIKMAWNHQQQKIDNLEKLIKKSHEIVESGSNGELVNGVLVTYKQACIIYSEWLKQILAEIEREK